jgi:hypothetical protein
MAKETKQVQRVMWSGRKMLGVEQIQTVMVHDAETYDDHILELYHQCKLLGQPAIATICNSLAELAFQEEPTIVAAATVLGISRRTAFDIRKRGISPQNMKLVKWHRQD